jgi:hypothetical protein
MDSILWKSMENSISVLEYSNIQLPTSKINFKHCIKLVIFTQKQFALEEWLDKMVFTVPSNL